MALVVVFASFGMWSFLHHQSMSLEMALDRVGVRKERMVRDSTNKKRGFAIDDGLIFFSFSRILGFENGDIYGFVGVCICRGMRMYNVLEPGWLCLNVLGSDGKCNVKNIKKILDYQSSLDV